MKYIAEQVGSSLAICERHYAHVPRIIALKSLPVCPCQIWSSCQSPPSSRSAISNCCAYNLVRDVQCVVHVQTLWAFTEPVTRVYIPERGSSHGFN